MNLRYALNSYSAYAPRAVLVFSLAVARETTQGADKFLSPRLRKQNKPGLTGAQSRSSKVAQDQILETDELPPAAEAYKFTHPQVQAISIKVWLDDSEEGNNH